MIILTLKIKTKNNRKVNKMVINLSVAELNAIMSGLEIGACEYTKMANQSDYPDDIRATWLEKAGNMSRIIATLDSKKVELQSAC